jgi:sterol desaturase/sphingolipid hydroxylase (fatty acid hydroxylase superfamily)
MAKAVFDVRAYVLRFFASWVGIILLLRFLDYHVLPSDEAVLQPAWASCIQHVPWLASHAGFPGLVGAVAFVISCLCFSVLDLRRSVSTKLQKHYFPSLWDMLKAGGPQVVLYGAGNWAGYAFGYHEIALPERAPRICIFAEEVLICFIVGDFFIYAEHRLMHAVPFLRKHIHSWHHSYHTPFSWAGGVVHPLEDAIVILCQMTTPLVLGYHPLSVWVFIFIWVVLLVEEHSGHDVSWAPYNWMPFASCPMGGGGAPHDIHHYKVNKNYGFVLCVWDHMLGTFEPVAT